MKKPAEKEKYYPLAKGLRLNGALYLMMLPAILGVIFFSYGPMFGIALAWFDYNPLLGFAKAKFMGWKYFKEALGSRFIWDALRNTVIIRVGQTIVCFPGSILLALLLHEVGKKYRKFVQTTTILPYFISWIVIASTIKTMFSVNGLLNSVLTTWFGWEKAKDFMSDPQFFRYLMIFEDFWKMGGYWAIIYLSAITAIDETLYEVARLDGAGRWRQMAHVTLPGIKPTILTIAILLTGYIVSGPFDQVFTQYSNAVLSTGDIIETYTYRVGFQNGKYGFSTAVSLLQAIVSTSLVLFTNMLISRFNKRETTFI